jgi:hypothetical protein
MAPKSLAKKDVPWCLLLLAALSTTCNICVLVGNYETAKGLEIIGKSTKGWSNVGLSISHSLQNELDVVMANMSDGLLKAINHTMHTSELLNTITALAGTAVDHMTTSDAAKAVTLLQQHMSSVGAPLGALPGLLTSSVDKLLDKLLKKAIVLLDNLLAKLKPVLTEVGKFIIKFGDRVQTVIEGFSVTLDRVQKLFDQVMASVAGHGTGEEEMQQQTFNLFDVSGTGFITNQDLKDTAKLYDISALRGAKPDELVDKYDQDHDGRLDGAEFRLFVHDPSIPNAMSVVLRSYAKRLAEVAGNVGAARQRDEVAQQVVHYLQLVCAKNQAKMAWVVDALVNGSLPLEFTSDILGELALAVDDPGLLTTVDVGAMVVGEMFKLQPVNTRKAYQLMSNATFWAEEGFHVAEHPICIKRVASWISSAEDANSFLSMGNVHQERSDLVIHEDSNHTSPQALLLSDIEVVPCAPELAFKIGEHNMKKHMDNEEAAKERMHLQMFQSKSSRLMLVTLLGDTLATHSIGSEATRMVKAGMPARPVTLHFAQWLAINATRTASYFQNLCLNYSSTSSNAFDSFAMQIQGMVKKIQGFIKMMERYSTPAGIDQLELKVHDFAQKAGTDILKIIKKKFGALVNKSAISIDTALDQALDNVGNELGHTVATAVATPLGHALAPALQSIVKNMMNDNSTGAGKRSAVVAKELAKILGTEISEMSSDALGHEIAKLMHDMLNTAMSKAGQLLNSTIDTTPGFNSLEEHLADPVPLDHVVAALNGHAAQHLALGKSGRLETDASHAKLEKQVSSALHDTQEMLVVAAEHRLSHLDLRASVNRKAVDDEFAFEEGDLDDSDILSEVWNDVATMLTSLTNVLPQATKLLKFARLEVSKLATNLDMIFNPFESAGPRVFSEFSALYRTVWTIYFCMLLPLNLALIFWAFWAGGYFGGPGDGTYEVRDEVVAAEHGGGRFENFHRTCCLCWRECHGGAMSFWSCLIIMQLVVGLLFIVALLFLVLGALKAFVSAGCQQMYILSDELICGQTLQLLRSFLSTFKADWLVADLPSTCINEELLVCKRIGQELKTSALLTCVFGFLAAVLSFLQLVESSALHSRAVWRRKAVRHLNDLD